MGDFEVVRSDVDGWDVRRVGEAQALSNFPTREMAEEAARREQEAEHSSGGGSDAIDVRQDVFSEGPEEELDAKKTLIGAGMVMAGVILLIAVVAVILVATGITT
jgi:hypothetical protein